MRVVLLSHDISSNAAGRAFILAKAMQPFAEVALWGPASRGVVWEPIQDAGIPTRVVPGGRFPGYARAWRPLADALREHGADAVYAVKPLYPSYGLGRKAARHLGLPLVADVDDWELGFFLEGGVMWKIRADGLRQWRKPVSYWPTARLDRLVRHEEHVTVSNQFLQERFGGTLVPHGRDLDAFDPARFDRDAVKEQYGLAGRRVMLFFGSPRPHKGVNVLLEAARALPHEDAVLAIVGANERDAYSRELRALAAKDPRVSVFGEVPFDRAPEVLALADVAVIPQLGHVGTVGQIPAKLGDAMAMGRAVVATDVGDIPRVLGDAGVIVPPGDAVALRDALAGLLDDAARREDFGKRARERARDTLSLDLMTERLRDVFTRAAAST